MEDLLRVEHESSLFQMVLFQVMQLAELSQIELRELGLVLMR